MKKLFLFLALCLALAGCYAQDSTGTKKDPVERYFYSELQEQRLRRIAAAWGREYVAMYVNGFRYTEITDRSNFRDAELVAALPRSYVIITRRPCPCGNSLYPTKFL